MNIFNATCRCKCTANLDQAYHVIGLGYWYPGQATNHYAIVCYREQQNRNRQLTGEDGDSSGPESGGRNTTRSSSSRRRGVAPPVYSLIDTGSEMTTDSEFETEAETSLSEPEYSEHEPDLSPPPYVPWGKLVSHHAQYIFGFNLSWYIFRTHNKNCLTWYYLMWRVSVHHHILCLTLLVSRWYFFFCVCVLHV